MNELLYFEINIICIAISFIIIYNQQKSFEITKQQKTFNHLISAVICMLVFDSIMWAMKDTSFVLSKQIAWTAASLYYICNSYVPYIWFMYILLFFNTDMNKVKKRWYIVSLPLIINTVITLLNFKYKIIFYISATNEYFRGRFFVIPVILAFSYIIAAVVICISNYKKADTDFEKRDISLIIKCLGLVVAGSVLQCVFYGLSLIWVCTVISALLIFINFQNSQIATDSLTKLNNRFQFERYMRSIIEHTGYNKDYALIMADIDKFKYINDTFGHVVGDKALVKIGSVLRKSCEDTDAFAARYGGDEFAIVLRKRDLDSVLSKISRNIDILNAEKKFSFILSLSIGSVNFNKKDKNIDKIVSEADKKMYEDKIRKTKL